MKNLERKIGGNIWTAKELIDIINQEYAINQNDLGKILKELDGHDLDYNGYKEENLIIDILFNMDMDKLKVRGLTYWG